MIALLDESHYLGPIRRVYGGAQFTHTAEVNFSGEHRAAYVKIYPPGSGGLVGEVIGYLACRAAKISCPDRAAIVQLDPANIAPIQLPPWLQRIDGNVAAWCTESVPGRTITELVHGPNTQDSYWNKILNSALGPKLAYLDEWMANKDRNQGAMIRSPGRGWCAIDHGEALGGSCCWPEKGPLDGGEGELIRLARTQLPQSTAKLFASAIVSHAPLLEGLSQKLAHTVDAAMKMSGLSQSSSPVCTFLEKREGAIWAVKRSGVLL